MNIRRPRSAVRSLAYALILATTALCAAPPRGWANLAPAGIPAEAPAPGSSRAADMKTITAVLESKALRGRLKSMGLDDKDVDARLSKLSDQDVHKLASSLEAVQPGGLVAELLVVVVLVLLAIYLIQRI
jgi:hypothetical protein